MTTEHAFAQGYTWLWSFNIYQCEYYWSLNNENVINFMRCSGKLITRNPVKMRLLCVAAVIHWELETVAYRKI